MAGHSKWAQTKHKKAVVDARRGKLFAKLLRAIEVSARSGGGNTQANPTLADSVQRAKDASVPADNIDRAIKRGTGEAQGISYENLVYEGFAPGGVAVIVEVLTDNRNRAAAEVRKIFSKHGGNLGEPGSVAWMFQSRGIVLLPKSAIDEEGLLAVTMDAGAEDLRSEGDSWEIVCQAPQLAPLRRALEEAGLPIEVARLSMEPTTLVSLDAGAGNPVLRLIDELEESDDVQEIYSNFDVPEEVLEEVAG
jgi:YebC/PmpR family DNA-binding regulatory protein